MLLSSAAIQNEDLMGRRILEIRITTPAAPGGLYPVELRLLGGQEFRNLTAAIALAQLDGLRTDAAAYGRALGEMLFADTACGPAFRQIQAVTREQGDTLHVRLLADPPELQALQWERIYQPEGAGWRPLGTTGQTPFSRYLPAQRWGRAPVITQRPLRLLVILASPARLTADYALDPIGDDERQALHDLFDALPEVQTTYLESDGPRPPTLDAIRTALQEGYHLVHFLCHGARLPGGTVLFLEKAAGEVDQVAAARVIEVLQAPASPPAFCFLGACESAARSRHDALAPLGPALVEESGVPAAVAMTERVGLQTARHFTGQFYARLLVHGLVDLAVNEGREQIRDAWDWGAPVLFSRLPDNQLLDFPVGAIFTRYLTHSGTAFRAADRAMAAALIQDHSGQLMSDLDRLLDELKKSYEVLVKVAANFRRTGADPATFKARFETYYYDFKEYYDGQTWVDEDTSCREIGEVSARVLPHLRPLLDDATYRQLEQELGWLSNADSDLLRFFREYLGMMNAWVEEIWALLLADQVTEAIRRKQEVEAQISPSLERSKELFQRLSGGLRQVAA